MGCSAREEGCDTGPRFPAAGARRGLLCGVGVLAALALARGTGALPQSTGAAPEARAAWLRPRTLWVTRPEAQESVRAVYWADAALQPEGCARLDHIFRDIHADLQFPIAPGLLHLNYALQLAVGCVLAPRPLVLISGYRCAATNRRVGGTTPNIHGEGRADDFIYEGLTLMENYRLARLLQVGGLGLYPDRGSLHKDIGPRRSWVTRGR